MLNLADLEARLESRNYVSMRYGMDVKSILLVE